MLPRLVLFLIFAFLLSSFILLLREVPRFTFSNHSFSPYPIHLVLLAGALFVLLPAAWLLYSKLASSLFGLPAAETLAEDFLAFLPLLFLSLAPLTLAHYLSAPDLLSRLRLFAAGLLVAVLGLKALQVRSWTQVRPPFWKARAGKFLALPLKRKLLALLLASLAVYAACAWLLVSRSSSLSGDEPHYLLISHSLLEDGDFDLAENYARQDYARFLMSPGKLKPHVVNGAKPRSLYSFHSPGVSLLLLPFYAVSRAFEGRALLFIIRLGMCLWGALFGLEVYLLARSEWSKENLALGLWFLASFTPPVLFYSLHVYPEIVIAFLSLAAYRTLRFSRSISWIKAAAVSFCLSSFFWFHALKYIALFLPLFVYALWTMKKKGRTGWTPVVFLSVAAAVILSYLEFQHSLYGTYSLAAVSWAQPLTGTGGALLAFAKRLLLGIPFHDRVETLAGYFLDQRDGLLLYAPLFLFSLLGAVEMARKKAKEFWLLLALAGPYVLVSAFLTQRTGYAPQARPLTAVIWAMVIWLGYFLAAGRKAFFAGAFRAAAAWSFMAAFLLLLHPANLYQETTRGVAERGGGLFYLLSNLHFRLPAVLPSYLKVENQGWHPNFIWPAALALFIAAYFLVKRPAAPRKFGFHLLLVCLGIMIFFVWIVLFPRRTLRDPLRAAFPSGSQATFYSLSRSARMVAPGRFQLREDGRPYRFFMITPAPLRGLRLTLGSESGAYEYEIRVFDEVFFRGRTVREARTLEIPALPRYKLGRSSYYELTLDLGKGLGPAVELNPYHFQIDSPGRE